VITVDPEREREVVADLQAIVDSFVPSEECWRLSMFGLISRYNATGKNVELIGGDWAAEHGFDLP
jgi:hypothetical protein